MVRFAGTVGRLTDGWAEEPQGNLFFSAYNTVVILHLLVSFFEKYIALPEDWKSLKEEDHIWFYPSAHLLPTQGLTFKNE